jgi:hypothetical protein
LELHASCCRASGDVNCLLDGEVGILMSDEWRDGGVKR